MDADLRAVLLAPFKAGSSVERLLTTLELTVLLIKELGFVRKPVPPKAATWSSSGLDIESRWTFFRW